MAKSKAQKALASGPSKIGAKARAAASRLKNIGSGKHSGPETDKPGGKPGKHAMYTGGKHAKMDMTAVKKNNAGSSDAPSKGKHSRESAMAMKVQASKPPKPQGQGISSVKEAVQARRKVRGK